MKAEPSWLIPLKPTENLEPYINMNTMYLLTPFLLMFIKNQICFHLKQGCQPQTHSGWKFKTWVKPWANIDIYSKIVLP